MTRALFIDLVVKRGDDRICSVDQLSSGEIEVLVFAQWVILNDVHAGLLVIDEPELHLHPSWQATILPALRELAPGLQFLVATHSDAVWDQASERFLLVDESDPRSQAWRKAHVLPERRGGGVLTLPSDLPALYSSHPLVLWVEDEETRTYLATAWQDGDIKLLVAGGYANIDTIVKAAERDALPQVFGVRDRDFWRSNRARWAADRSLRVFTGDTFEIENLLLDATAMAACEVNTAEKDAATLQAELDALAAPLVWWMSCRKTIVHFRDAATKDSIEHPTRGAVTSRALALSKIVGSPWWTTTLPAIGQTVTEAEADRLLESPPSGVLVRSPGRIVAHSLLPGRRSWARCALACGPGTTKPGWGASCASSARSPKRRGP